MELLRPSEWHSFPWSAPIAEPAVTIQLARHDPLTLSYAEQVIVDSAPFQSLRFEMWEWRRKGQFAEAVFTESAFLHSLNATRQVSSWYEEAYYDDASGAAPRMLARMATLLHAVAGRASAPTCAAMSGSGIDLATVDAYRHCITLLRLLDDAFADVVDAALMRPNQLYDTMFRDDGTVYLDACSVDLDSAFPGAAITDILQRGERMSASGLLTESGTAIEGDERTTVLQTFVTPISDELIRQLTLRPDDLRTLSPPRFEELVAELLTRQGYSDVKLAGGPGDGGVDIYATLQLPTHTALVVVQCKRYAERNPVRVHAVRDLHGVVLAENATVGVLATTSRFTSHATKWAERDAVRSRLSLKGFSDIVQWLQLRQ